MRATTLDKDDLLKLFRQHLPDFAFERARILPSSGQFNNVLCIDDRWIFRFPKSPQAAADLARELALLPRLQGKLPLPIPKPRFHAREQVSGELLFMGYPMLPGEPLLRETFAQLQSDSGVVDGLAHDLARFLRALHAIAPADIGLAPARESSRDEWTRIGAEIREKLYPFMRADAKAATSANFARALADDSLWQVDACLIHGDFGTGNILVRAGRVSAIIDFGFCGVGDPAQDLGAILASYGEDFVARVCRHYPALRAGLRRARFYMSSYALIQALYALRDGDAEEFDDGMRDYV